MENVTLNLLKNKKVLVTGGSGFIGINLIMELLKEGAIVTALDLPMTNWEKIPFGVRLVKADILKKSDLINVCDDIEIIYHLAAKTDLDGKTKNDYKVNYEGTQNLIEEAAKSQTLERFVFYSTFLVAGESNETRFIDETEPYRTKTVYGESKIEGEKIVKKCCSQFNIPFTIIRPTSVYGPWGGTP
jgi:nucleoside-diphosphate-sugar epimerase